MKYICGVLVIVEIAIIIGTISYYFDLPTWFTILAGGFTGFIVPILFDQLERYMD